METSLRITNKSNHFRDFDAVYNTVTNPASHAYRNSKRQGYEARLFYEYKDTIDKGGFVCFLTLTYNNLHCPTYEGHPCFDVEDIRFLTHGKFSRMIEQEGYHMKYFVSCELGDGKGVRKGQNPHYHMLLFLVPFMKPAVLSPHQVLHMVKEEWQGFDEANKFRRYELADHGIVRAGKFGVKVDGFRALSYCAKYVTKNTAMLDLESKIAADLWNEYKPTLDDYISFCDELGIDHLRRFSVDEISGVIENTSDPIDCDALFDFGYWVHGDSFEAQYFFNAWYSLKKEIVDHKLRLWRNRYSDKVRISDGVGKCSKDELHMVEGRAFVQIPSKNGMKLIPAPLYTYRQKFCDVVKDRNGNNRYILNKSGIELKLGQLDYRLEKARNAARYAVDAYLQYPDAFPNFVIPSDLDEALNKYAHYNVIYKYRRFRFGEVPAFLLDPVSDYKRFLQPAGDKDWNPYNVQFNNHLNDEGYFWYLEHPYFKDYAFFFGCVDGILDKLASSRDDENLDEYEKTERLKKDWQSILHGNYSQ